MAVSRVFVKQARVLGSLVGDGSEYLTRSQTEPDLDHFKAWDIGRLLLAAE